MPIEQRPPLLSEHKPLKPNPAFRTGANAERFGNEADLTEYDLSGFARTRFAFVKTPLPRTRASTENIAKKR